MVPGATLAKPVPIHPSKTTLTNQPIRRLAETIRCHLESTSGLSYLLSLSKCAKISLKDNKDTTS